jgi:hypothetical protein
MQGLLFHVNSEAKDLVGTQLENKTKISFEPLFLYYQQLLRLQSKLQVNV